MSRKERIPGTRHVAERMVAAEEAFISTLESFGGISHAEALKVYEMYRKMKVIKRTALTGEITVKHGAFLDRDVIRNALKGGV